MKVYEFSLLDCSKQVDLLQEDGVFIGKLIKNHQPVVLYQLYDFYVEIVYRRYRMQIASIRYSASTRMVEPYLERINIDEVIGIHGPF